MELGMEPDEEEQVLDTYRALRVAWVEGMAWVLDLGIAVDEGAVGELALVLDLSACMAQSTAVDPNEDGSLALAGAPSKASTLGRRCPKTLLGHS